MFTKPAELCFTVLNIRIRPLYHVSTEMSEVSPCFCLRTVFKFTWNFKTYKNNNTQLRVPKSQKRIRPHNKSASYNTTPTQADPSLSPQPLIIFMLFQYTRYIQLHATLHSLLYPETAVHVSSGASTHHQGCIQLYLQNLVSVTLLQLPAAIVDELESTIAPGSCNGVTNTRCCR